MIARCAALILMLGAPVASAQRPTQGDDDSAALVGEGRAQLRAGALDAAARALDQAIALNPRRVEAYVLRAAVDAARGHYAAGIALLRNARALAPADEDVLTALGSQLVLSGDTGAGVPLLAQVVARDPARYDAAQLLGHHLYATGAWAAAIPVLEAYFAHRPAALAGDDARHLGDLGDAYLRAGQPRQALATFERAARGVATGRASSGLSLSGGPGAAGLAAPRIQLGRAWAMAATDCGEARRWLRGLEPAVATYPEIGLVDGRCALVLGDAGAAIDRGRAYVARVGERAAPGYALIGEAFATRGNWSEARHALEAARALAPDERRWTVRLASVVRRGGDPRGALAALDQLGRPAPIAADPAWWAELGEALLAAGDARAVIARLAPAEEALPRDPAIALVRGAAWLADGDAERARPGLELANAALHTGRSRQLLGRALATLALGKLASAPAAAEALLVRASEVDDAPAIWRDLGIARLALGTPAGAIDPLDRAIAGDPAPLTLMLAARARALAGELAAARPLYERALAAAVVTPSTGAGPNRPPSTGGAARGAAKPAVAALTTTSDAPIEIALDWAASELASDPALAIAVLERVTPRGSLARRHAEALATARHAAAVVALRAGNAARAVELLKPTTTLVARCDLALASVVAGEPAGPALAALGAEGCPFPTEPHAVAILGALTDAQAPRRASAAVTRLAGLAGKPGAASPLLAAATRIVALAAAAEAYRGDQLAQARSFLATAGAATTRLGADELAHDQAVLDLADGKLAPAIAALERLAPRLPDALVALGIAYERAGQPEQALDAWRRAQKAGVRFAALADWIDAKQRIYGAAP